MKKRKAIFLVILFLLIVLIYFIAINKTMTFNNSNINKDLQSLNDIDIYKDRESILNTEKRIVTKSMLDSVEKKARKDISNFNFRDANDYIDEKLSNYDIENLSVNFKDFANMYFDLPIMCQFEFLKSHKENKQIRELIKNLQDVENFFVSVMWLDRQEREYLIYMDDSINPVFNGGIKITNKQKVDKNEEIDLDRVDVRYSNIEDIIKIEFEIEGNDLIAYIVKTEKGLGFYKITEKNKGSTRYYTIDEWEEIYKEINDGLRTTKKSNDVEENNEIQEKKGD